MSSPSLAPLATSTGSTSIISHKRKRSKSPDPDPDISSNDPISSNKYQQLSNETDASLSPSPSGSSSPSSSLSPTPKSTSPLSYLIPAPSQFHTRIGPSYQITHPLPEHDHTSTDELDGTPVWLSSKCDPKLVDEYLVNVAQLFHFSDVDYCEELALEFLHHCDYDTVMALNLLLPQKVEEEVEDEAPPRPPHESDDICAICGDGGQLIICDGTNCKRVYHVSCTGLGKIPSGRWECSAHFCTICRSHVEDIHMMCVDCPTSYCAAHCPPELKQRSDQIKISAFRCVACTEKQHNIYIEERQHVIRALQKILMGQTGQGAAQGGVSPSVPKVDLAQVYKAIQERGGIETVMSTSAWRDIAKMFHLSRPVAPTSTPATSTTPSTTNEKPIPVTSKPGGKH